MPSPDSPIGVVIVDDHQMFADSLAARLRDEPNITVLGITNDPTAAADLVTRLRPDVLLLDYRMPQRDGVSVAAEIKAQLPEVMIVMLTGSDEDQVLLGAIDAGCSGFLTKDRAAAEVVDAVVAAAAGEALISPVQLARLLPKLQRTYRAIGSDLTERELTILRHLAQGAPNSTIAEQLHLSVNTVRNYVQSILTKLNAHSKLEAVSTAVREGIIDYSRG